MTIDTTSTTLTTTEAAAILHVSADTLRRWTDKGVIDHVKTEGGHRRYQLADVQALVYRQTATGNADPLSQMLNPVQEFRPVVAHSIEYHLAATWQGQPGNSEMTFEVTHKLHPMSNKSRLTNVQIHSLLEYGYTSFAGFTQSPTTQDFEVNLLATYDKASGFVLNAYGDTIARTTNLAQQWLDGQIAFQKQRLSVAKPRWGVVGLTNEADVSESPIWYSSGKEEIQGL